MPGSTHLIVYAMCAMFDRKAKNVPEGHCIWKDLSAGICHPCGLACTRVKVVV